MATLRKLAVGTALVGAAVGPASAEPLSGDYTGTVTDTGGHYREGKTANWTFSPCGPDCTLLNPAANEPLGLQLQGDSWTGSHGNGCTTTIDNNSLVSVRACGSARVGWQLAKNG
jgi:hypothetical protein